MTQGLQCITSGAKGEKTIKKKNVYTQLVFATSVCTLIALVASSRY